MAKNSKRDTQTVVTYKGSKYVGVKKAGKVQVRVQRTACGQNMLVGVFNPADGFWHNDTLPHPVKREIEACYG